MKKGLLLLGTFVTLAGVANAQLNENFNSLTSPNLPVGWSTSPASAWKTGQAATLSSTYFPVPNYDGNFVMVNDDKDSADYSNAILTTSSVSLSGLTTPYLNLMVAYRGAANSNGAPIESLKLQSSVNGGTTWTDLYTFTKNVNYWWEPRYINLSSLANQSNVKLRFVYNDMNVWSYGAALDNVNIFNAAANDIKLATVSPIMGSPIAYGVVGNNVSITGSVFNNGANPITSYVVKYQEGSSVPVSYTVSGVNIPAFTSSNFTHTTPYNITTLGAHPLKVWVELAGDNNHTNDTLNTAGITGVSFMPAKKLLFEEGTGTWCVWCPRGAVFMDSFAKVNPNAASLVAVHNNDPMAISAYDNALSSLAGGYPNLISDRGVIATADPSNIFAIYNAFKNNFGYASITATPSVNGNSVSIPVNLKAATTINEQYRIALIISEEGVTGTGPSWNQRNAYAGGANGPMGGWENLPSVVSGVKYNHVARYISNPTGSATGIPATFTDGQTASTTLTATLDPTWTGDLKYIVVLFKANGQVANTASGVLRGGTSVSKIAEDVNSIAVYPNPSRGNEVFLKLDLKQAQDVNVSIVDISGKVLTANLLSNLSTGQNTVRLPIQNLANGTYLINVKTKNGTSVSKLSIMK